MQCNRHIPHAYFSISWFDVLSHIYTYTQRGYISFSTPNRQLKKKRTKKHLFFFLSLCEPWYVEGAKGRVKAKRGNAQEGKRTFESLDRWANSVVTIMACRKHGSPPFLILWRAWFYTACHQPSWYDLALSNPPNYCPINSINRPEIAPLPQNHELYYYQTQKRGIPQYLWYLMLELSSPRVQRQHRGISRIRTTRGPLTIATPPPLNGLHDVASNLSS